MQVGVTIFQAWVSMGMKGLVQYYLSLVAISFTVGEGI
jgi:hypothetical protein